MAQQSRRSGTSSRSHVSISVWLAGGGGEGGGEVRGGEERGRMAGGKKHGEDRLNVANVNYASGVPGVPEGPR